MHHRNTRTTLMAELRKLNNVHDWNRQCGLRATPAAATHHFADRGRGITASWDAQQLVHLKTEAPPGMREAEARGELRVPQPVGPVHRLQEPVPEIETFEAFGRDALLGEHQLQLVPAPEHEL